MIFAKLFGLNWLLTIIEWFIFDYGHFIPLLF